MTTDERNQIVKSILKLLENKSYAEIGLVLELLNTHIKKGYKFKPDRKFD